MPIIRSDPECAKHWGIETENILKMSEHRICGTKLHVVADFPGFLKVPKGSRGFSWAPTGGLDDRRHALPTQ